jgi:transposase
MISDSLKAEIIRLFHAEHWKIGTIADHLHVHPQTVQLALGTDRFRRGPARRALLTDPYIGFIEETLRSYPRLRATIIYEMIRGRGYTGSVSQLRRILADIRPPKREAFLRLQMFPGEQGQMDWAHFGTIKVGQANRKLSCFVLVLSYSRAVWIEFFYDQSMESLLAGHVHAFESLGGVPRTIIYDNMKTIVIDRIDDAIEFNPRILDLASHYHFAPKPARPARGNEKGRVERTIHYIRHSFFMGRRFLTLQDLNQQALKWRNEIAHRRPWPEDKSKTVEDVWRAEQDRLLPLPNHPFETDQMKPVRSGKTIYVRFDQNDYSIPPSAVGKQLTAVANISTVRILDGAIEVARHKRSFDSGKCVSDPLHLDAVLAQKRKATGATAIERLRHSIPDIESFLQAATDRGESVPKTSRQLIALLLQYGASAVAAAVKEALQKQTPRISSVIFILDTNHRRNRMKSSAVDLSRHPHLADVSVPDTSLEAYDELNRKDNEDE